jgi:hypothetical protein
MTHIAVFITLIITLSAHAFASDRLVHRWTDAKGQVHYGDARAATLQPNAKPVRIQRPMSIVHNDRPIQMPQTPIQRPTRKHKQSSQPVSVDLAHECEQRREQLSRTHAQRQALNDQQYAYNERCIRGHYYGKGKH